MNEIVIDSVYEDGTKRTSGHSVKDETLILSCLLGVLGSMLANGERLISITVKYAEGGHIISTLDLP